MRILTADYVVPISSDTIVDGAVAVEGDEIAAVGREADLCRQFPAAEVERFGRAAILPGLVNSHSHLEITSMRNSLDAVEHDFAAWLIELTKLRAAISDEGLIEAAIKGAREGLASGVTCFGDIGRTGIAGLTALRETGVRGVLFQETNFSPLDETADADFDALINRFEQLRLHETSRVQVGLSPHSPYTVGPRLLSMLGAYSISNNVKLSIHSSESAAESELMQRGAGYLKQLYDAQSIDWQAPQCSSIEYLDRLGVLAARPLLAHCVTVSQDDIARIADHGASIAHCPKSNAKFGHGYAPLERFVEAKIDVGLGSDSVASNNLCDLLEEGRFAVLAARNRPERSRFISAREVLEIATLGGARSLGLDNKIGTLEAKKRADLAVFSLDSAAHQPLGDIEASLVFATSGRDCVMAMVDGEAVYRA